MCKNRTTIILVIYPDKFELPVDVYFSVEDLAKKLGISEQYLRKVIKEHKKYQNRYFEKIF